MMTELYWKAFVAAIAASVLIKWLLLPGWSFAALFTLFFAGTIILFVIASFIGKS